MFYNFHENKNYVLKSNMYDELMDIYIYIPTKKKKNWINFKISQSSIKDLKTE